ncbi:MAG: hypothetical protein KF862_24635 [Chitinophagaceae bacterium]|nr:hypothetical protein [Chitinophagaceae bacterium]
MISYSLIELHDIFVTNGLKNLLGREFAINKMGYSGEDVKVVTDRVVLYFEAEGRELQSLQTFGCGSWMLQFIFKGMYIELHELKDVIDGHNKYDFDLTLSISFLKGQLEICNRHGAKPDIPLIGQKVAVSKEIYEGSEVNGVRYKSPSHMTGWYLTSNSYKGDIKSLSVDHLYHLLKKRPDLAKFMALPFGYRFYKDFKEEDVWLDEEVVKATSLFSTE